MKKLLEGLLEFQTGYFDLNRELFEELSQGQSPRILFITCSDSRIDPNLITQAKVGELFVIRNAGNIIPPYGATNGGEGASIEYAIQALADEMPLVYDWLKQAEATRRLVKDNYPDLEGEELIEITVAENVLNQLDNLQTYPSIRSRLHKGSISLHGWIYRIETGEVLSYNPVLHDFVPPQSSITPLEPEYNLHPSCSVPGLSTFKIIPETSSPKKQTSPNGNSAQLPGKERLPLEQSERIYRGSQRY